MRITVDKAEICTVGSKDDAVVDALIPFLCEALLLCSVGSNDVCVSLMNTFMSELRPSRLGQMQRLVALTQTAAPAPPCEGRRHRWLKLRSSACFTEFV